MEVFRLQGHEYIELNKLLKILQWVETGGEANIAIADGEVMVNGEVELRKRNKLRSGTIVKMGELEVKVE